MAAFWLKRWIFPHTWWWFKFCINSIHLSCSSDLSITSKKQVALNGFVFLDFFPWHYLQFCRTIGIICTVFWFVNCFTTFNFRGFSQTFNAKKEIKRLQSCNLFHILWSAFFKPQDNCHFYPRRKFRFFELLKSPVFSCFLLFSFIFFVFSVYQKNILEKIHIQNWKFSLVFCATCQPASPK